LIYNIKIKEKPTTFIVLKVEIPFKCNPDIFENIYREQYKNRISHKFIRNMLGLSDSVKLKLNGTFERWLHLLDEDNRIYQFRFNIQTAAWFNIETAKWQYVSIFPIYIKKYCHSSLNMLEYISCHVGKGENIFRHIDDPNEILDCEDSIVQQVRQIEKDCLASNYTALLNSRYTEVFNRPLVLSQSGVVKARRFSVLFTLVQIARKFFGIQSGVLSLANSVIQL
jgi:hypothetical protein